ncbi:MAG: DUF2076 domain-containing protein [Acetobacter sp.]|nr:DUF2076 domain-containing protein [Acetobacter sp.]
MTDEERALIEKFFARVGGVQQGGLASVPETQSPQTRLPPIDPQADQLIAQQFQKYPEARYRLTQMAVVQEAALVQAQHRIQQLQAQLQQAQQSLAASQQKSGGFFSGLFGGGKPASPPQSAPSSGWGGTSAVPPPQYQTPSAASQGMFRGGSGFLGSALTTATGVAGGMLAANAIESLFSGHHGGSETGGFFGSADSGGEAGVTSDYGNAADAFGGSGVAPDSDFGSGWGSDDSGVAPDSGFGSDWGDSGGDFGGDFGGGDWGGDF